jgi:1-acyl-sn-glycerol-3-phosphate acyltransferase
MRVPVISTITLRFFRRIVRGCLRRHFHGVRASGAERFTELGVPNTGPVIVYANHGSWWDPMVSIYLAERLMTRRQHYAPMDAAALERYGILKRVGMFGVKMNSTLGAMEFLKTSEAILWVGGVLWITPQGRFVDTRSRPLEFKHGLATLATRVANSTGRCTMIPLAIEYTFWDERLPECLLLFGKPVKVEAGQSADMVHRRMLESLELAMDELAAMGMGRDASRFDTLTQARVGTGGCYGWWEKLRGLSARRAYHAEDVVSIDRKVNRKENLDTHKVRRENV